jgi:hypothetical protein
MKFNPIWDMGMGRAARFGGTAIRKEFNATLNCSFNVGDY